MRFVIDKGAWTNAFSYHIPVGQVSLSSRWTQLLASDTRLQVTPSMLEHISYGTFIFFGSFSLAGGLFIWFFVPETKGACVDA